MTPNEYQEKALRTENFRQNQQQFPSAFRSRLVEGLMGLNGESGEAIDILKKCMFQGYSLKEEREHLILELGDVAWYLALSADALGCKLDYILEANLKKLEKRYPNGFTEDRSLNRKEDDI